MGVILDTSVVISAQRKRLMPVALIRGISERIRDQEIFLSAVGYTELVHGHYRCTTEEQLEKSLLFLQALTDQIAVVPYTIEVAAIAGKIDAEQQLSGNVIPLIDLMIGATALANGFSLLTTNLRHFRQIPDLDLIPF